jgi:hypothetical protein
MGKDQNGTIDFINEEIGPTLKQSIKNIKELIFEESEKQNPDNSLINDYKVGLIYMSKLNEFMKNYKP